MVLIPKPRRLEEKPGAYSITKDTVILLDISSGYADFELALSLRREIEKMSGVGPAIAKISLKRGKNVYSGKSGLILLKNERPGSVPAWNAKTPAYRLKVGKESIEVTGCGNGGLFYGVQTLRQLVRNGSAVIPCLEIEDYPAFENRGFYHDITRGRVPTLETLEELADRLSFYKVNQLQLYVEHSFAFRKHSEIWIDSDPVTPEEILILDEYCRKRNIELVPSLSTFGHLYHALISRSFRHLNEYEDIPEKHYVLRDRMGHYTLDASKPESPQFVYDMIDEFLPLFTSDKFNICCDETFDLGQGRNKKLLEEVGAGKLYLYFVKKIIEYVKTYDKKVMMWGDILLNHPEEIREVPGDVTILNWDYSPDPAEDGVRLLAEARLHQYVCPGVQGWNKLINKMDAADKNIGTLVAYGEKYKVRGVLNTDWGDYGHINLLSGSIPGAIFGAGLSWNPEPDGRPSDEAISRLEYGDGSGRLIGLVRELSRQAHMDWDAVVLWYYVNCGMNLEESRSKAYVEHMTGCEENKIKSAYTRIRELAADISALYSRVYEERQGDLREFLAAADGLALFQALLLVIKKEFLGQTDTGLIFGREEMAEKLEYWFAGYKEVWRRRNKESELFRLKEVIMGVCGLLREINSSRV